MREHHPDFPIALLTYGGSLRMNLTRMSGLVSHHVHVRSAHPVKKMKNESLCSPATRNSCVDSGFRVRLYSASPFQETVVVQNDVFACGRGLREMLAVATEAQLDIATNTREHSELALPDDSVILIRFSQSDSKGCQVVRFLSWWASQIFNSEDDTVSLMRIMRTTVVYSRFRLRFGRLAATMAMQPIPANSETWRAQLPSHTLVVRSAVTFYRSPVLLGGTKSTLDWCAFINTHPARPRAIAFNSAIRHDGRSDLASSIDARSTWPDMHARVVYSRDECNTFLHPVPCREPDWNDAPLVEPVAGIRIPIRASWTFLHIPKTGGTSIESAAALLGIPTPISVFHALYCTRNGSLCTYPSSLCAGKAAPWHFPPDLLRRCARVPDVYAIANVFCVVRHPFLRFVSEFVWRKANPAFPMHGIDVNLFAEQELGRLQHAKRSHLGTPRLTLNDALLHVIPQSWYLLNEAGQRQCDYWLRFERLEIDWSTFVRRIRQPTDNENYANTVLPKMNALQVPVSGMDVRAQIAHAIRKHHVTNITLDTVQRAYREDYVLLGYSH
eukprot:CAMPEP_0206036126 /NCGR_PEP_ID=MMETSP1466-20131121/2559_1 /ASSEMBLY_ACC=CAM_ASM_001126 /TAXON_ID=44452 /ORGANISM="Pavlova gyrans, Strain CCMP608" /LENGTH=555 /DNA_ID=CAMNT_0053410567 /DNA_START=436 /DNA_END=2103 /DNA_ORIENTATION=+